MLPTDTEPPLAVIWPYCPEEKNTVFHDVECFLAQNVQIPIYELDKIHEWTKCKSLPPLYFLTFRTFFRRGQLVRALCLDELTTGDPRHQTQVDKVNLSMVMMVIVVESSQVDIGAAA